VAWPKWILTICALIFSHFLFSFTALFSGRICGNKITSRIEMAIRQRAASQGGSMPMPMPGGRYSVSQSANVPFVQNHRFVARFMFFIWSTKRSYCSCGSLSSKPLAHSIPLINTKTRSAMFRFSGDAWIKAKLIWVINDEMSVGLIFNKFLQMNKPNPATD